ncbi:hypothetical protein E2562_005769 [Oryza meyeriana var. granulata]|uniref:Uncharacterized protein n=1 Tax=Oryza meyeriana var. granulata TaxID=110450 RepID=A0A6G1F4G5_9ORYZ|nr:hypothetical protein E2562_005769 [Oryza meyeriana var. granulata]
MPLFNKFSVVVRHAQAARHCNGDAWITSSRKCRSAVVAALHGGGNEAWPWRWCYMVTPAQCSTQWRWWLNSELSGGRHRVSR